MADYPDPSAFQNFQDGLVSRLSKLFKNALKNFYERYQTETNSPLEMGEELFEHTASKLLAGVDKGFGKVNYGDPSEELLFQLRRSALFFSAHKTYLQVKELGDLLIREDGTIRPFAEFRKMARPLIQQYNLQWLRVEYNAAVASARAAKDYQKALQDIDIYPNLKYMPSVSATPRDSHKKFYGLILPVQHPFWRHGLPPSDWECKCWVEQTDEDATQAPTDYEIPKGPFANNPAISGELFSADHPYFLKTGNPEESENWQIIRAFQKTVKETARKGLAGNTVSNGAFNINFTVRGIKEAANQPHAEPFKKLLLLNDPKRLTAALGDAEYLGSEPNRKEKNYQVRAYHYFRIRVGESDSYAVMQETEPGKLTFYSIVDRLKEK